MMCVRHLPSAPKLLPVGLLVAHVPTSCLCSTSGGGHHSSKPAPPPAAAASPAMGLFLSNDLGAWRSALASYPERLDSAGGQKLAELDSFVRTELPQSIQARQDAPGCPGGFVTKAELERVMKWKLRRGKWRPGLQGLMGALQEKAVKDASSKAFAKMPDLKEALKEVTVLKGVGPATASALLAAHSPDVAPFMSDEALMACVGGKKEYTAKKYLEFAQGMQNRSKELQSQCTAEACSAESPDAEHGDKKESAAFTKDEFTVGHLEMALWADFREGQAKQKSAEGKQKSGGKSSPRSSKRRKV